MVIYTHVCAGLAGLLPGVVACQEAIPPPLLAQPRLHLAKVETLHDLNGCHSVMELYMPTAMIDQQQLLMTRINV